MRERWQIYQKTLPTVPPGGSIGVPLTLDSDAPFALRRIKSRNIGLNGWRYQHPGKNYQSDFLRTDVAIQQSGSSFYPTQGAPCYPQSIYPPNSQIVIDVGNATDEPIENARLIFYGSKLFADSAIQGRDYPPVMSPFPFIYPLTNPNGQNDGPVSLGLATSPTAPAVLRELQLRVSQDADFALRYMVADPWFLNTEGGVVPLGNAATFFDTVNYTDLYVVVKDEARKPYMNEPIHIDDVFGQAWPSTLPTLGTDTMGVGPIFPGLLTPELIIEREHSLYVDLYRFDTTGFPVDLWLRFHGAKIFRGQR